jgi:hypothetical protein
VKTIQHKIIRLGLLAMLAAPLAGCSGTWQGVKNDWHDMTGSNDSAEPAATQSAAAQPSPAAQPMAQAQPMQAQAQVPAQQPMAAAAPAARSSTPDPNYSFNK